MRVKILEIDKCVLSDQYELIIASNADIVHVYENGQRVSAIIPEADVSLFIAMKHLIVDSQMLGLLRAKADITPITLHSVVRYVANQHARIFEPGENTD